MLNGEQMCEIMTVGSNMSKMSTMQVATVHKQMVSISCCVDMGFECFLGGREPMCWSD